MKLDCESCRQREIGCDDCVVTLLMSLPAQGARLNPAETEALAVMAESGLVPPLRLQPIRDIRRLG